MRALISLVVLGLGGCAVYATPVGYQGEVVVAPAPVVVEPAYVWYGGVYGFWYEDRFYERSCWHRGFHGEGPHRFEREHGGRWHR